jgi:hypothetical protein
MGWTSGWISRNEIVTHILKNNPQMIGFKLTNFGKHLWIARGNETESYIVLYLIKYEDNDWGYKSISEDMGPCYFDCPSDLLDKTTGVIGSKYSDKWRNEIGQLKSKKKVKYKEGDYVEVAGMLVKIIGRIKRSYKIQVVDCRERKDVTVGSIYKASAKDMSLPTQSIDYLLNE